MPGQEPAAVQPRGDETSTTRWRLFGRILMWAAWFGLLTGFLELANFAFKSFVLDRPVYVGIHTIWLAPWADALTLIVCALPLALMALVRPYAKILSVTVLISGFLMMASLALLYKQIHILAVLILSVGFAAQLTRLITPRRERFSKFVAGTLPLMFAAAAGLTAYVLLWLPRAEADAIAQLPSPPKDAPNVVLIVWDTVRSKSLSLYGYERETTPGLAKFAKSGVVFDRALATAPWTLPTHSSLFTGRWARELSSDWEVPLDDTNPTLAEMLRDHGYLTGGFISNYLYCGHEFGLSRGFSHYEDFSVIPCEFFMSSQILRHIVESGRVRNFFGWKDIWGRKDAERINQDFLAWVDERPDHRPFFAFLNFFDAHEPYLPPPPYDTMYDDNSRNDDFTFAVKKIRQVRGRWRPSPEADATAVADYDCSINVLDDALTRLVDELRQRKLLDNTIVIVTSDHGEQFREHDMIDHGNSLYRPLIHVPLVIVNPQRLPEDLRVAEPVTLRDVPTTVMDLTGIGQASDFPGQSLTRYWTDASSPPAPTPNYASLRKLPGHDIWRNAVQSVEYGGLHYIRFGDGREEVYDFLNDVNEERNLIDDPDRQEAITELRELANAAINESKSHVATERPSPE